ncbi:sushi, nidogen and EGF-like domain-containing protein 1 [Danio rerio]|uniref:Sushi, nidogen and EGF-like domain-containing protein 1 n=1 Tax=Danio rerio TaxID=7955 RepID=A0AC58GZ53_DANRE
MFLISSHLLLFLSLLAQSRAQTTIAGSRIFYPFGSSARDTINPAIDDGSSSVITLLSPFLFFGRTYQQIYVNNNGYLTFSEASSVFTPYSFPAYRSQDIIAGLWTDLNNEARGVISYNQYTNGSVLTRATQDINNYFPNLNFTASWFFVATWDKVPHHLSTAETSFQVVLISGSKYSFILMNYGNIAATERTVEAGFDTISSTNYFVIPGSNIGSSISSLNTSSNVNVRGRWAFRVDGGPLTVSTTTATPTTTTTTTPITITTTTPTTTPTTITSTTSPVSTTLPGNYELLN